MAPPLAVTPVPEPTIPPPTAPPAPPPAPLPGELAPHGTTMASEMDTPGSVVAAPMAEAGQRAGTLVIAPIAPATGPIPVGTVMVTVPVKPWWQSSEIVTSLLVVGSAIIDSVFNAVIPLLGSGPVDKAAIKAALIRSVVAGAYAGFMAIRRKMSNSVVA